MAAIGVTGKDLQQSSFDLVMADRRTPLLSIGQRDLMISYGGRCVPMTVVFCPEIRGMLICRLDCVNLEIIHKEYPKPLLQIRSVTSSTSDGAPDDSHPSRRPFLKDMYLQIQHRNKSLTSRRQF